MVAPQAAELRDGPVATIADLNGDGKTLGQTILIAV